MKNLPQTAPARKNPALGLTLCVLTICLLSACQITPVTGLSSNRTIGLSVQLTFKNGTQTIFAYPSYDYAEISAVPTTSMTDSRAKAYAISAMSDIDNSAINDPNKPMRAIQIIFTPVQTLDDGTLITASAAVRVTELPKNIDATYSPKTMKFNIDDAAGLNPGDYIVPPGNGILTFSWHGDDLLPVVNETSYIYQAYGISTLKIVAKKYSQN